MNRHRQNFVLALILFAAWVGTLATLARYSAERPRARSAVASPR